jgi:hypothetical protein
MALQILNKSKNSGLESGKEFFDIMKGQIENEFFISVLNNYFEGKTSLLETDNILFDNLIEKVREFGISDWERIGTFLGRENVFKVFKHLQDDISDKDYWIALGECYIMSSFSNFNYDLIKSYFQSQRQDRIHIMTKKEQLVYESLPNEIVIYRGCSEVEIKSEKFRFSWTTKESVAKFFAKRNKILRGEKNLVVSKIIKKEDALAFFNRRKEFEIIYLPKS